MALLLAAFMAGCASNGTDAGSLVSVAVTPQLASIPVTGTQQYTAIATYSDGSSRNVTTSSAWTSPDLSGSGVATIGSNTGLATGNAVGTSTITATYPGQTPATAILTVNAATVVSINVTPATASIVVGGTQQYTATAILSDGSSLVVTANPGTVWTSASPLVAANPINGLATGSSVGTSNITAAYGGQTSPAAGAILTVTAGPDYGPAGAVDLGTAGTYGVMANSAITLSAPAKSHIYGDVGILTTDSFTGFTLTGLPADPQSIYVTGEITSLSYNPTNYDAMVTAFDDLKAAWVANNPTNNPTTGPALTPPLATSPLPAGGTFTAAGQDLTGLLLGPGIYASDTPAGTLALSNASGPLVLDAGGNADAVFIFQASDITTTSGSVVLRNGAQADNVYWVLTATATIGDGTATTFQGTVLAGTDVTVGLDTSVQGRVLAGASLTSGALTINGGVITVP